MEQENDITESSKWNNEELNVQTSSSILFDIDKDLGANYFRKFTKNFEDFNRTFGFDNFYEKLETVMDDPQNGDYLKKYKEDTLLVIFKLDNNFPPLAAQKSSQLDIVVAQKENDTLPAEFNIRLTHKNDKDNFNVNQCEIICFGDGNLEVVKQKFLFWNMLISV